MSFENLYRNRFKDQTAHNSKNNLWKVLCRSFFQRYVDRNAVVLDLAAGYCEFINNIECKRKIAIDINEDVRRFASDDVEVHLAGSDDLSVLKDDSVDVVFISNFFEHLPNKDAVLAALSECNRVLKPSGNILIMQPNIRFAYREYWDFFDHILPISDKSLCEALQLLEFDIRKVIPQFLPYSTKSGLPQHTFFVKWYLRLPFVWHFLGKQFFVAAQKKQKNSRND